MQKVEEGSVIYRNLSRLYAVLWPNEVKAMDTTYPVTGVASVCPQLPEGMEVYQYRKSAKWDDQGVETRPEVQIVRYEGEGFSRTYLLTDTAERLLFGAIEQVDLDESITYELAKAPIEFPLAMLQPAETHELDDVTQEELNNLFTLGAELHQRFEKNLDEISKKSNRFVEAARHRDHDLYMTFVMRGPDMLQFGVRYDKVYPTISESGEFTLGQGEQLEIDIHPDDKFTQNVFRRIQVLEKSINRDILRYRNKGNFGPAALKAFDREVKTLLFAASHFSRRLYPFDAAAGLPYLEEAANKILDKLYAFRQRNQELSFGLDVNSWIVWSYPEDGSEPVKVEDETLDFIESVLNSYTESFVNVLTGFLMDLGHTEVIRPYHYLIPADASDGIEIGSIRQVS